MNITKKLRNNIIFFVAIALLLFTPLGTFVKVQLLKVYVAVSSPASIEETNREVVNDFHWNLVDSSGKNVNFQEMEGEIILINFWATWCPPCIAEMPNLNKLHKDYGDKIKFLFVANDAVEKVNAYLGKNQYNLPVYYSSEKAPKELYSNSIPATFLIDDRGKIIMKKIGVSNWNSETVRNQIDELLAFSLAE
ncbi:TlpA disulfide reductase family protein [Kordia algicida OT-1]|uniref:Thioredoxin n=1 Tax=Kordia algicida OT-1 TaxID=391587 RepID=A9DWI1_9FLAO|nr:TlpA disulfide reductase family protein [Kordia algicida]EDP95911.1 thioredoxin [Kordia algicida OT-1]